ncbi:MAG TPA: sugar transferase [bacterium]|nr:sugar transferase [bacterium]HPT29661.1 sugar transferase [bacterium]
MLKTKIKQTILVLGDLGVLAFSLYLTLIVRYQSWPSFERWHENSEAFLPVFATWLIVFYINSLYQLKSFAHRGRWLESFFKSTLISFIVSILFFYLFPFTSLSPRVTLIIFVFIFTLADLGWRYMASDWLKNRLPKNNLAIVGYNQMIAELAREIKNNPHLGYDLKFIIAEDEIAQAARNDGLLVFSADDNLEELASKHKINIIVLEKDIKTHTELHKKLFNCLPLGITYISLASFFEYLTGRVPLDIINRGWFLENLNLADKKLFERAKRVSDLSLALFMLVITAAFWPLIALSIKLESRGPVFFKQMRLGKNNIPFVMYKFRTMKIENNSFSPTAEADKRITKIGNFLRKSRIDELPQIINIIKSEMSLVGPRPERPELIAELDRTIPFFSIRTLVKPGLSGWDQISGEYHSPDPADAYKKLQHDLYYIKNRTVYLDWTIVLKTIKTTLTYKGR